MNIWRGFVELNRLTKGAEFLRNEAIQNQLLLKTYEYFHYKPELEITTDKIDEFRKELNLGMISNGTDLSIFGPLEATLTLRLRELFQHIDQTAHLSEPPLNGTIKHRLEVAPSRIPNAGQGLFVKASQRIVPGTIVALYPGLVHAASLARSDMYLKGLLPDDDYLLLRRLDGTLIDARKISDCPSNPYGLGHMINHCGSVEPNVKQVSYDFPDNSNPYNRFPPKLHKYIPNRYFNPHTADPNDFFGSYMKTILMVATKEIQDGEEILMDYRFNPKARAIYPSWYVPHDENDAFHRSKIKMTLNDSE